MTVITVTEEAEPGRWVAVGDGCRREGRTEAEALDALRQAVFERAAGRVVATPAPGALT